MLVEEFNNGYYLTEVYVEPTKGNIAVVNEENYRDIQYELYPAGEHGKEIMFKIEEEYVSVEPDRGAPNRTLQLPNTLIDDLRVRNPPKRKQVLIPKPWMVRFLNRSTGI